MPCQKCGTHRKLTRHHVLPRRFFGVNGPCCVLCRKCHDLIEKLIPEKELQTIRFYWTTLFRFLERDRVAVVEWSTGREYHVRTESIPEVLEVQHAAPDKGLADVPRPAVLHELLPQEA